MKVRLHGLLDATVGIELPIALEEERLQLRRVDYVVTPCGGLAVEPIEIGFRNPTRTQKIFVLIGTGNGRQDIEGRQVRLERPQDAKMLADLIRSIPRKADNVGKVRGDPRLAAKPHDIPVCFGMVLRLVRRQQSLPAKRFHADEVLKAA